MVISSCLLEVVGVDRVWIMVCVSNPRLLKSCVLCLCGSPCNCDSDGRLDCFRSPVVVAVDVVRCVGGASTERVCCLLVLNLVSSTLPCIRQPRPRLRVLDVCGSV